MTSFTHPETIHLGLDVHKDSIAVGILHPHSESPEIDKIFNDEESIRRLISRFPNPALLSTCYEAGPTGYELHRLLTSMGVACQVIAPSMIPKAPGDKVKTDKRDCRRLARLHRAGELVAIRVPSQLEEGIRDLCRTREDMVSDLTRAHNRLTKFLLRHGVVYRDGSNWTQMHERWLSSLHFDTPAMQMTFEHYRCVIAGRTQQLHQLTQDLEKYFDQEPFTETVHRLGAYRGITHMGALTLAAEVCDWKRFGNPRSFMGFVGLIPSEYSSGSSSHRGHITKAGNSHIRYQLIESAWSYQHHPYLGATIKKRQEGLSPEIIARAWNAQLRLCGRFRHLSEHKNQKNVVVAAVARELAGFLWAEMTA